MKDTSASRLRPIKPKIMNITLNSASISWVQTHRRKLRIKKKKTFPRSEKHSRCYISSLLLKRKHDVRWKVLRTRGSTRERMLSTVTLYQHSTCLLHRGPLTLLNQSPRLACSKHSVVWAMYMYIQWQFKVKIKL